MNNYNISLFFVEKYFFLWYNFIIIGGIVMEIVDMKKDFVNNLEKINTLWRSL